MKIQALVSLLADDDPRIAELVWKHLVELGDDALPELRRASEAGDPRLRARARHSLSLLLSEQVERELSQLTSGDVRSFDLESAFHALARVEDPDLPRESISRPLDLLVRRMREVLVSRGDALDIVMGLDEVFHQRAGFRAVGLFDAQPEHACLNHVLESKKGVAVSLAAILILAARRMRLPIFAAGLPGHVLILYREKNEEVFLDPARAGRILTRDEVTESYLRDYHPGGNYIRELGRRELALRALRTMHLIYVRRRDRVRVRRLGRYLQILQHRGRGR